MLTKETVVQCKYVYVYDALERLSNGDAEGNPSCAMKFPVCRTIFDRKTNQFEETRIKGRNRGLLSQFWHSPGVCSTRDIRSPLFLHRLIAQVNPGPQGLLIITALDEVQLVVEVRLDEGIE